MMTSTPTNTSSDSLLFTNVIDYMDISNLILESSSDGRFVKFRLTVESEDSRWLRIYDAINNSEIMSFRTELLRPQDYGGRVLMIRQESLVGYFKLGTSYSKNGLQPIIIDARNDTRYMIQHDIERLVQLGQMNHIYTSTLSGRHSSGADGSMPGIKDTGVGIFQGYIEITVDWIMNGGDFDSHGYEFWIYNRDDRSRVVHKKFHFDYGSNYGFTKNTYKYVLTSSEVAQLGGRNTSLAFQGRIRYDSGSGGSDVCRGEFYITTK